MNDPLVELAALAAVPGLVRLAPSDPECWLVNDPALVELIEDGERSGTFVKDAMRTWRDVVHVTTDLGRLSMRLPHGSGNRGQLHVAALAGLDPWLETLTRGEHELVESAATHFVDRFARFAFATPLGEDAGRFAAATRAMEECKGQLTIPGRSAGEVAELHRRLADARSTQRTIADRIVRGRATPEVAATTDVREAVIAALIGAAIPSSCALGWVALELHRHPAAVARARDAIGAGSTGYVRALVYEALRLYPPGWMIHRRATSETRLGSATIGRDAMLLVCPYFLHRDERTWRDATAFMPERFLRGGALRVPRRMAFRPFGGGARMCAGAGFAVHDLAAIVTRMLEGFELIVTNASEVAPLPLISLRPSPGVRVTLSPRSRW